MRCKVRMIGATHLYGVAAATHLINLMIRVIRSLSLLSMTMMKMVMLMPTVYGGQAVSFCRHWLSFQEIIHPPLPPRKSGLNTSLKTLGLHRQILILVQAAVLKPQEPIIVI